jgi:dethiobiotin synthetase
MSMRGLFVTGTGTGVGKSVVSAALLAAMIAAGEPVLPHKPVLTGLDEQPDGLWPADDELLGSLAGVTREQVAPVRFGPPASPHLAAELAGTPLDPQAILAAARAVGEHSTLLIEGVGGLLVPLHDSYTVLDLAAALGLPLVIVATPGLGTINHTLLSLRAARGAGVDVAGVVLSGWPTEPTVLERSNRETIARLGGVEVHTLRLLPGPDAAQLAGAGEALPWREWLERR